MGENPELIAMARRICADLAKSDVDRELFLSGAFDRFPEMRGAVAAIIETQRLDAALVERMIPMPGNPSQLHGTYAQGVFDAATAIRSGQHYGKDHPHD